MPCEVGPLGFSSVEDFQVNFMEAYFGVMDPNALLCMAWKWQRGDVSRLTDGDLAAALGRIRAKTFVMPISEDMFFPPRDCAAEEALIPDSELRVIDSVAGHLGLFGLEPCVHGTGRSPSGRAARHETLRSGGPSPTRQEFSPSCGLIMREAGGSRCVA